MATMSPEDESFRKRVEGAMETVLAWETDVDLLKECRNSLPWDDLRSPMGPYSRPEDSQFACETLQFFQRLCRYFQSSMTWVNNPPCRKCGDTNTTSNSTRTAVTPEEIDGKASRVEIYDCGVCQTQTTFPRYNSGKTLFQTRKGRCGEYANLFGMTCRSVGFQTRYVLDMTDHVWVEVNVRGRWVMADGCEGVIDEPSMYEAGWGKKLNYIVAAATDHVMDVTPRYTRKFVDDDFAAQRRAITTSEQTGEAVLAQLNDGLRRKMSSKIRAQVTKNYTQEQGLLRKLRQLTSWQTESYSKGRISGSVAWKVSRGEAGEKQKECNADEYTPITLQIETIYPSFGSTVTISVSGKSLTRHSGIMVGGAACAVGEPDSLSVVVVDEKYLGCVLQSRCFFSLEIMCSFIDSLPNNRIVVMNGLLPNDTVVQEKFQSSLSRLGRLNTNILLSGVYYIGQVGACPDWAVCVDHNSNGISLQADLAEPLHEDLALRTQCFTKPSRIVGRVPENIMPLQTQVVASHSKKREAFLSMERNGEYVGYTTRPGMPIYLLNSSSFPLNRVDSDAVHEGDSWSTFLYLPNVLVPDDDVGFLDRQDSLKQEPLYEVPVDIKFFTNSLGGQILSKDGGALRMVDLPTALRNSRLVGLYFSAHWCGPCRSFTPLLVEMYTHLKNEFPTHGLEIVFVSSDRDQVSFSNYYRTMPWLAIPFDSLANHKDVLSITYGIHGIPSLVVVDALSGKVIASAQTSRREVMEACRGGDKGIEKLLENWLQGMPIESRDCIQMLSISCQANETHNSTESEGKDDDPTYIHSYLYADRSEDHRTTSRNEESNKELPCGPLDCRFHLTAAEKTSAKFISNWILERTGSDDLEAVLSTALKYIENTQREPWNARFRSFKLSNKVADRMTRVSRGLELLQVVGFEIESIPDDFSAYIPPWADLSEMYDTLEALMRLRAD